MPTEEDLALARALVARGRVPEGAVRDLPGQGGAGVVDLVEGPVRPPERAPSGSSLLRASGR